MRRPLSSWLLLLAGCGAHISGNGNTDNSAMPTADANETPDAAEPMDAAVAADAPIDAPPVLGPWGTPKLVGPAATTASEDDGSLSSNALELIFSLQNANNNNKQLYYTSRATLADPWTTPATKLAFNSNGNDQTPRFSADDKTLYFASGRGTSGNLDIYMITRNTAGVNTWNTPAAAVSGVSRTDVDDKWFAPCDGGRYVEVRAKLNDTTGDTDLFEGVQGQGAPTAITTLNTTATETSAFLTQDCLTIYFASARVGGVSKLFTAHRDTATSAWPAPTQVTDFKIGNGTDNQEDPWMSPDGRTFALSSDASGSRDVYLSTR